MLTSLAQSITYLSFCEALGYCRKTFVGLPPLPNAGLKFPDFFPDVISAACTIENGLTPSSENAFKERTRLSGSDSALSSVLARFRTSNDVSVSLASSSLDSRSSGVCRFLVRNGVPDRCFEARGSVSLETAAFLPFSWDGIRELCDGVGFEGAAGRAWTILRI